MGRPTTYSQPIADRVCDELAQGKSMRQICAADDMPADRTIYRWLDANESFRQQYARAREEQADHYAAEIIALADTCREGKKLKETKDGTFVEIGDMVERSRLQIDARKWFASKVAPKKYGDKQELVHSGKVTLETLICGEPGD